MRQGFRPGLLMLCVHALAACAPARSVPSDGGAADAGCVCPTAPRDAGAGEGGAPFDAGGGDDEAGPGEAGPLGDAGLDAGLDAGPLDAGLDAGRLDAGRDAGLDAGSLDAGGIVDAALDAGLSDAGDPGADAGAGIDDAGGSIDAGCPPGCVPLECGGGGVRYPFGARHSPLACGVVARLREIAQGDPASQPNVFMKVGDSITATSDFLACFATEPVDLDASGHGALEGTLSHFLAGDAAGATPFDRVSLAAQGGMAAAWAISGSPPPIEQERAAIRPRYAVVMYGTNDLWHGGGPDGVAEKYSWYYENMSVLLDTLLDRGVVPILSTIPPNNSPDVTWLHDLVPTLNAVVVGLAQARQLPVMNYHDALLAAPGAGLGPDGIHPNTYAFNARCDFSGEGLRYGYNIRNLITLEALDRVHQVVSGAREAWPDAAAPHLVGSGTPDAPFSVPALPFVDARDTRVEGAASLGAYGGCSGGGALPGREHVYRLDVSSPTRVRALALDRGAVDARLRLLEGTPAGSACRAAGADMVQGTLSPGTWYFVVDTPSSAAEGESLFVITACEPGDARCDAPL